MIGAYAIAPEIVATWGEKNNYRYFKDKFGIGTPRCLFEIPKFSKWRKAVLQQAQRNDCVDKSLERLLVILELFDSCRFRHESLAYDADIPWLDNAEQAHDRCAFSGIIATDNPHGHQAVIIADNIGATPSSRWDRPSACTPARDPAIFYESLSGLLLYADEIRIVDPYFAPETPRHRTSVAALGKILARREKKPSKIEIHCKARYNASFFEEKAAELVRFLPLGHLMEFFRWEELSTGEVFHNRYILTNIGGVTLGKGIDLGHGDEMQTEDINLMSKEQWELRRTQFQVPSTAFKLMDTPKPITGTMQTI